MPRDHPSGVCHHGVIEAAIALYRAPEHTRSVNGPEFIAYVIQDWLEKAFIRTSYITPGSPWENRHIESFHDKLRDECLNRELFGTLAEAQVIVESWRVEYNDLRPHSSLGYLSPSEYMLQNRAPKTRAARRGRRSGGVGCYRTLAARKPNNKTNCGSSVLKCPSRGVRSAPFTHSPLTCLTLS